MARLSMGLSMLEQVLAGEEQTELDQVQSGRSAPTEVRVLSKVQGALKHPGAVKAARGLSHFGEHSAGWFAAGLLGAALDRPRPRAWLVASACGGRAHAAAIA